MHLSLCKIDLASNKLVDYTVSVVVRWGDKFANIPQTKSWNRHAFWYVQGLELIPSENFVSSSVMEAVGSIMTNKYSEGYPGQRYYGGNEFIDMAERMCQVRIATPTILSPSEFPHRPLKYVWKLALPCPLCPTAAVFSENCQVWPALVLPVLGSHCRFYLGPLCSSNICVMHHDVQANCACVEVRNICFKSP